MEKQLHILIIEDNESDAALIIRFLKKADYNIMYKVVDSASTMEAALEKNRWDFVISDFTLPQFNALSALSILQATKIDIPFIVVSGNLGEETAVEIMKAGAHDYIMTDNLARLVPVFKRELAEAAIRREHKLTEEAMLKKMDELAASNEELNRINRLTIGREMRMIELKHHCNALAVQLGIEKPYPLSFLNEPDQEKNS
jgi:DNA-binding NtrC family response regulator